MLNRRSFVGAVMAVLSAPLAFGRQIAKGEVGPLSNEKKLLELDRLMDMRDGKPLKSLWPHSVSVDRLMRLQSAKVVGFKYGAEERLGNVQCGNYILNWTRWRADTASLSMVDIPLGYVWLVWVKPIKGQEWEAEYIDAGNLYIVVPGETPWESSARMKLQRKLMDEGKIPKASIPVSL